MLRHGLILDLDGTIVDTLPHIFDSFRYAVQPFLDHCSTDEEIFSTFGPAEATCIAHLLGRYQDKGRPIFHERVNEAARRYHTHYEANQSKVTLFPGMRELMDQVRQMGWSIAVFTGKGRRSAEYTLEHLDLNRIIDCLVTSDDVTRPKPEAEGVLMIAERLGISPENVILVGDSPADILAGKRAGAETVAALWGAFDKKAVVTAQPDWVAESIEEVIGILVRQNGPSA